ncbi:hypothetical protein SAMN05421780_11030 [Flexibacter flexilis DSM 6793]|uniref:Uncharacterized protein n=1 Tax=Flexibacter flexilis DSM 6793 TaxID=927664 RepID=A0A1I1M6H0_9BACT|nr:hypothetical protein [Flexibacter flexilis]SFC80362.1 hypothetical protein SAMN05421780_11030 [Flexibacter flexilis DSM 6793]
MKLNKQDIVFIICGVLLFCVFVWERDKYPTKAIISTRPQPVRTDTALVDKIKAVPFDTAKIEKPNKVLVQALPDTALRKRAEKKKIVRTTRIDLRAGRADIETITPRGTVLADSYENIPTGMVAAIAVNDTGAVNITYKTAEQVAQESREREKAERKAQNKGFWRGLGVGAVATTIVITVLALL